MRIECPNCGRAGLVPGGSAGRPGKCPACGATFMIAAATAVAAAGRPVVAQPHVDRSPPAAPAGVLPERAAQGAGNQTIVYVNQPPSNGLGVAGFVISLIGFLSCGVISPLGLILSVAGLSKEPRGLAIAGTILGGLGSIWVVVLVVLFLLGIAAPLGAR